MPPRACPCIYIWGPHSCKCLQQFQLLQVFWSQKLETSSNVAQYGSNPLINPIINWSHPLLWRCISVFVSHAKSNTLLSQHSEPLQWKPLIQWGGHECAVKGLCCFFQFKTNALITAPLPLHKKDSETSSSTNFLGGEAPWRTFWCLRNCQR